MCLPVNDQFKLTGGFWDFIGKLSEKLGTIGYLIIGIFIFSWLLSSIIYNVKKYDDIEVISAKTDLQERDRDREQRG